MSWMVHISNAALADQMLRNSVAWDDPDFSNGPYPADLCTDLDGDGRRKHREITSRSNGSSVTR